jgi:hypothetical protein
MDVPVHSGLGLSRQVITQRRNTRLLRMVEELKALQILRLPAVTPSKIIFGIRSPLQGLKSMALLSQSYATLTLGYFRWLPPGAGDRAS